MSICPYVISYIHIYIHTSLHIHTYSHVGIFFCSSFHLEFQYMSSDCPCCLGQVAAQDDLNSVSSATPSPSGDYPGAGRRKSPFFIGKSTNKIAIVNSYVSLPEGIHGCVPGDVDLMAMVKQTFWSMDSTAQRVESVESLRNWIIGQPRLGCQPVRLCATRADSHWWDHGRSQELCPVGIRSLKCEL
jgi:hypothetical protein